MRRFYIVVLSGFTRLAYETQAEDIALAIERYHYPDAGQRVIEVKEKRPKRAGVPDKFKKGSAERAAMNRRANL